MLWVDSEPSPHLGKVLFHLESRQILSIKRLHYKAHLYFTTLALE